MLGSMTQELQEEKGSCMSFICGGQPPKGRNDDQSFLEKLPTRLLPKVFRHKIVSMLIYSLLTKIERL